MQDKFLRAEQAAQKCGFSISMLWAKCNPNNRRFDIDFPKPVRLSIRAVGWRESELNTWIESRSNTNRIQPHSTPSIKGKQ